MLILNGPIVLSGVGVAPIGSIAGKTPAGYMYSYMLAFSGVAFRGASVCMVELPYYAAAHLFGEPKDELYRIPHKYNMKGFNPVRLEGNFNEYFNLFVRHDLQSEARYILDPKAMHFVIDFCKKYYWEIADDTLLFVTLDDVPDLAKVDRFIEEIKPSVIRKGYVRIPSKLPYRRIEGREVKCPRCEVALITGRNWMCCPAGHGMLMTGGQMVYERTSDEDVFYDSTKEAAQAIVQEKAQLTCPYCKSEMRKSHFQSTTIELDICTKCPHRWLDAAEVQPVIG